VSALEWMGDHPIITVALCFIVVNGIVATVAILAGVP
jgi:hypothetical protein